jgi:hypothetical protein
MKVLSRSGYDGNEQNPIGEAKLGYCFDFAER